MIERENSAPHVILMEIKFNCKVVKMTASAMHAKRAGEEPV